MKLAISNPGDTGTPGLRCCRLADGKWLDPDTLQWGDVVPGKLIPGVLVPGDFAPDDAEAGDLAGKRYILFDYVADLPIDDKPGTYWIDFRAAIADGHRRLRDPLIVVVDPPPAPTPAPSLGSNLAFQGTIVVKPTQARATP